MPDSLELPFEMLFRNHNAIMLLMDGETGRLLDANTAALFFYGYTIDQIRSMKIGDINMLPPEELDAERKRALAEKRKYFIVPHRLSNGELRTVEVHTAPISMENRKYLFSVIHDISERKRAEESLRLSEERFRLAYEASQEGLWEWNIQTDQEFFSPRWCEIIGYSVDDPALPHTYKSWEERIHPDDIQQVMGVLSSHLKIGTPYYVEYRHRHKTGEYRWQSSRGQAFLDVEGKPTRMIGYIADITERKQAEGALQNVQKLESLGLLAGGIAHDFNNLLGGIFGFIELAAEETNQKKKSKYLSKALSTIDRARALTGQLLTFAKGGAPVKKLERLAPFIEETAQFALSGSNVTCQCAIPDAVWQCEFDKNQIGQVVDNIVINAQQAMPDGGTIEVAAENLKLADTVHPTLPGGAYVKISIKDHGVGMPREILPRIFDPFFTTKAKGHGLGLAICYSIVKRHGGCIEVESEPGKGSTFTVYLPASPDAVKRGDIASAAIHHGSGPILVMDDEESMRDTLGRVLESMGYTVHCVENSKEAIDAFRKEHKRKNRFVAVVLDLTIPGGPGGKETVREIRKIDKDIPAFVASGYADDPVMSNPDNHGFNGSICKPFRKAELTELFEKHLPESNRKRPAPSAKRVLPPLGQAASNVAKRRRLKKKNT